MNARRLFLLFAAAVLDDMGHSRLANALREIEVPHVDGETLARSYHVLVNRWGPRLTDGAMTQLSRAWQQFDPCDQDPMRFLAPPFHDAAFAFLIPFRLVDQVVPESTIKVVEVPEFLREEARELGGEE